MKSLTNQETKTASRGVTLMAFGKPVFFEFAFNLAMSLKDSNPKLPIQLIHDGYIKELGNRSKFFDVLTPVEYNHFAPSGKVEAGVAKCHLYEYLAFDETIYLDVDGLVYKDLKPLFDKKRDFVIQADNLHWVNEQTILKEKYGVEDVQGSNSSIMFIRKGETAESIFNEALKAIKEPISELKHGWFGMQPDELYLGIGMAKVGLKDIYFKGKYPMYLRRRIDTDGLKTITEIKESSYGVGVYGNFTYNHHLCYKLYNSENNRNWYKFIKMSSRIKVDKLMKLKR